MVYLRAFLLLVSAAVVGVGGVVGFVVGFVVFGLLCFFCVCGGFVVVFCVGCCFFCCCVLFFCASLLIVKDFLWL